MTALTSEADDTIRTWLSEHPSIEGYVFVNSDGIPVKHDKKLSPQRAIQSAALFLDLTNSCGKLLREIDPTDPVVCAIRLRTKAMTEVIIVPTEDYWLAVTQNCGRRPANLQQQALE